MVSIQTDVSEQALVTAIRANMCDFFRFMSRSTAERQFENEHFVRWYTPLEHPWFNGVLASHLPTDDDGLFIDKTIQYFHDKGIRVFTWWMEPPLRPSDWESVLSKYKFGFSNDTPGMAVDLYEMNESRQPIDGLEIRDVNDEETLRLWAKIFVEGYGLPPDWETIAGDLWMKMGFDLPIRNYLGYLNGEPVSTSTVFYGGGAAGIYCVATSPWSRGKGIGGAVTLKPLQDARELGYRIGVLQSSEMGFNVYKRLGFRHLCQIENFYLMLH